MAKANNNKSKNQGRLTAPIWSHVVNLKDIELVNRPTSTKATKKK